MLNKLDFNKLLVLFRESSNRLSILNTKEALEKTRCRESFEFSLRRNNI